LAQLKRTSAHTKDDGDHILTYLFWSGFLTLKAAIRDAGGAEPGGSLRPEAVILPNNETKTLLSQLFLDFYVNACGVSYEDIERVSEHFAALLKNDGRCETAGLSKSLSDLFRPMNYIQGKEFRQPGGFLALKYSLLVFHKRYFVGQKFTFHRDQNFVAGPVSTKIAIRNRN
jgi:hypothetical protein